MAYANVDKHRKATAGVWARGCANDIWLIAQGKKEKKMFMIIFFLVTKAIFPHCKSNSQSQKSTNKNVSFAIMLLPRSQMTTVNIEVHIISTMSTAMHIAFYIKM